jgi:hypothetical protein
VTVLLLKLDSALDEVSRLKVNLANTHKQIENLNTSKRELSMQSRLMVPLAELQVSKAEASKLQEDNSKLEQKLLVMKSEVDGLKSQIQVQQSRDCQIFFCLKLHSIKQEIEPS